MDRERLMNERKRMVSQMEKRLQEIDEEEKSMFHYHPNEDRIVLSHALFWVMSKPLERTLSACKCLLLLRRFQEEMLEAYLTESDEFPELLHYCNVLYEILPYELTPFAKDLPKRKSGRKLSAIGIVAAGYAGEMDEKLANDLLDSIDFHYNKVRCLGIERMLPRLNELVIEEELF